MKKIYYSYLLNRERDPALVLEEPQAIFTKRKYAIKARLDDCIGALGHKPGKLVKITLETIDD